MSALLLSGHHIALPAQAAGATATAHGAPGDHDLSVREVHTHHLPTQDHCSDATVESSAAPKEGPADPFTGTGSSDQSIFPLLLSASGVAWILVRALSPPITTSVSLPLRE
jgi:hypothetical protein